MDFSHEISSAGWYLLALAGLLLFRRLLGAFLSVSAFFLVTVVYLRRGFEPAMPSSLFLMFVIVTLLALLLYATSNEDTSRGFFGPILRTARSNHPLALATTALCLIAIPALVAVQVYAASLPSQAAPPKIRSIHPSPPTTITFSPPGGGEAHELDIVTGQNPYREWKATDPAAWAELVVRGKDVYYENCFFCHGDTLDGDGHLADALSPVPARFQAKDTIPMLTEAFLFWRIAKGGPGLPQEGTPWDSSMPAWESFLIEADIWASIAFLYDYTGYEPRTQESAGGGH